MVIIKFDISALRVLPCADFIDQHASVKILKMISTPANSFENLSDVSNSPRTPVTAVINHTRHSAQKSLDKSLILVDVNNLGLLPDLPEKSLKPCSGRGSGPIVKIVILVSV